MKKLNKKAIIGDTLTWMFAFLIIFFLMLIFDAISLSIAKTKSQTFLPPAPATTESSIIALQISALLDTPVTFQGNSRNFSSVITEMTNPFLDKSWLDKYKIEINSLYLIPQQNLFYEKLSLSKITKDQRDMQEKEFLTLLDKLLIDPCKDYFFKIPQAYYYKKSASSFIKTDFPGAFSQEYLLFLKSGTILLNYKGFSLNITLIERNYCNE